MSETTREVLGEITALVRRLADSSDTVLAEFFSDFRGVHDDLADLADEIHLHAEAGR